MWSCRHCSGERWCGICETVVLCTKLELTELTLLPPLLKRHLTRRAATSTAVTRYSCHHRRPLPLITAPERFYRLLVVSLSVVS